MSSISQINTATTAASTASTASTATAGTTSKKDAENPQDRFLKLLVTQMKNQDPLKPLDNAEVTSQLAQITTVTGLDKLNSTLQQLVSSAEDTRSVEAMGLIGHKAFVPGSAITLNGDGAIAGIELAQPVDQLKVTILDGAGVAIRTMDLGAQPTGISTIPWDGLTDSGTKAVDGDYTFAVSAKQGGNDVKVDTLSFGVVKSVTPNAGDTHLDMGDKLGLIGLSDVKQLF